MDDLADDYNRRSRNQESYTIPSKGAIKRLLLEYTTWLSIRDKINIKHLQHSEVREHLVQSFLQEQSFTIDTDSK